MARRAISVTLESDNVTWLKGRAGASGDSVSEVLDQIVSQARHGGRHEPARSVAGTIDIDPADPLLIRADDTVRSLFDDSLARPLVVRESRARMHSSRGPSRKRRG
jgi:hypothetical protein